MDRPVRVAIVTHSLGSDNGIARVETLLLDGLDRERVEPVLLFTDPASPESAPAPSLPPGCRYVPTKGRFEALLGHFSDVDLVHVSWSFDPVAWEAARVSGAPALLEVMHNPSAGAMHPSIDLTVCVSRAVRAMQPPGARTRLILNSIDVERFPFATEREPDSIPLLELSRRNKDMHFHLDELAPDLLGLDPRLELWLAGNGQKPEGPVPDRVRFLGLRRDAPALLGRAAMMVLLSRREPFGLASAEAMASGCLPLVSNDGGMAEVVEHEQSGWLVDASDRRAVVDAVSRALALLGTERWRAMQERGRARVEKEFNVARYVREYEDLYLEMVRAKGVRREPGPLDGEPAPEADLATAAFRFAKQAPLVEVVEDLLRMAARARPLTMALSDPQWHGYLDLARALADQAQAQGLAKAAAFIRRKLQGEC